MISVLGYSWGNFRVAGIINGISPAHAEFLNDGGLGLSVGDGMLPHPGNERIIETYYSFGSLGGRRFPTHFIQIRHSTGIEGRCPSSAHACMRNSEGHAQRRQQRQRRPQRSMYRHWPLCMQSLGDETEHQTGNDPGHHSGLPRPGGARLGRCSATGSVVWWLFNRDTRLRPLGSMASSGTRVISGCSSMRSDGRWRFGRRLACSSPD